MQNLIAGLIALIVFAIAIFIAPLIGICVGAFIGWVAGLVFPGTIGLVGSAITGLAIPGWQVGAILGFVGGFFKGRVSVSKS